MVHHLKYGGYPRLASLMGDVIARHTPRPGGGVLVPIPLTARRFQERGYNQAALIARALSRTWGIPVREELLARCREGGSQTALTPEQRAVNVAGAFSALPPLRQPTAGTAENHPAVSAVGGAGTGEAAAVVIIVDDVLTTGATLVAAAKALAQSGWSHVGAVTFARALPFERRVN